MSVSSSSFPGRNDFFDGLRNGGPSEWDVIVIGGGITGAGVLREASRRGYRCLLLEQQDFTWGTSSRSSKMIHGGLRYLASGDWALTRDSLQERERLLDEVPGLVERIDYYLTLVRHQWPGRWAVWFLLTAYDILARINDRQFCSVASLKARFSGLDNDKISGAYRYTDAMTDDSRLVLRLLQESIANGASALNYTQVKDLFIDNDEVCGVIVQDPKTDALVTLRAASVVSATGAWADRLRNRVNSETRIRPLRGSHLVIPAARIPVSDVFTFFHPVDRRGVYVYPWEGCTVIGTTDLDHAEDLDIEASISQAEIDYLCAGYNNQFPSQPLTREDIISSWAGVRPVIGSERSKDPSKERRDHAIWSDKGLITASGGKLTTFRLIAIDVLNAASERLPSAPRIAEERFFEAPIISPEALLPSAPARAQVLIGRYGQCAESVLNISHRASGLKDDAPAASNEATETAEDPRALLGTSTYSLVECRWAARHEAVEHLDDLLLRRTRLGMVLPDAGAQLFPSLQRICQQELGWDAARWETELQRYLSIYQRFYSLPEPRNDTAA